RTEQHFSQAPARLYHRPDVFGLVSDEVQEHKAVLVLYKGLAQCGLDISRILDTDAYVTIAFDQLDEIGQRVDIRLGITGAVFDLLPLPDHAEIAIVQAKHLGRKAILLTGGQFLDIHLDGAFARDHGDVHTRVGHLRAHGVRQPHAHGAQTTGGQPATRLVELVVVGRPHLVLAYV